MFNFNDPHSELWNELGDPQTLLSLEHLYTTGATPAISSVNAWLAKGSRFLHLPAPLPERPVKLEPGSTVRVELRVGMPPNHDPEHGPVMEVTTRLHLQDVPTAGAEIEVKLNGHSLGPQKQNGRWIEYPTLAEWMRRGANEFEIKRAPGENYRRCVLQDLLLHVQPPSTAKWRASRPSDRDIIGTKTK